MFTAKLKIAAALLVTLGPLNAQAADDPAESPLPAGALARLGTSRFHHAFTLRGLAFSPDHKIIASASVKTTIRLWDAETGKELRLLTGHTGGAVALAFSPDGKTLASSSWDRSVRLWDVASGNALRTLTGHEAAAVSVTFSPDGKQVLSASSDGSARLWDSATGQELSQMKGHEGEVTYATFSRDGKFIATSGADKTARLWDATGKELRKFEGHTTRVRGAAFSPDGKRLVTGGWDTTARLWDVETGKQVASTKITSGIEAVAYSPDGKAIAAAAGWADQVYVWDVTGDTIRQRWTGKVGQPFIVAFSGDGKKVAASGWDSVVHVWDAATGKEFAAGQSAGHNGWIHAVSFLADRKTLVSASDDGTVIAWDTTTGKPLRHVTAPAPRAWSLAVSPDGKTLVVGCHDQTVQLWDAITFKLGSSFKADGSVRGVAFSPDGKRVAAVCGEDTENSTRPVPGQGAGVWDAATGQRLLRLEGHDGAVKSVAYSPDGKTIATGGADKTARLWDGATGKELRKFQEFGAIVDGLAFSPDGKLLAAGARGGTVRVWRVAGEDAPMQFNVGNNYLAALAFSADGRMLATACRGAGQVKSSVRVWDVATGKERARFAGHQETAISVCFSADGRRLASGGGDGTVLLWDLTGRVENGSFVTAELSPPSLEGEWADLVVDDGLKVHKAIWTLAAAPKQALPLLRDTLKPVPPGDAKRIAQLVKDLDADDFDAREKATTELEKVGAPAEPALRKALEGTPSAEMRIRAARLLEKFAGKVMSADDLRRQRALEVLEHIGGAEARTILEEIAKGAPEAGLTLDAKAALKRLGQ
jgi:WD40 repeat protein